MVSIDRTVVSIALPPIQRDLHVSTGALVWVVSAYTLMFGGLLLPGGRATDLLGQRRVFLAGVFVFSSASALSGLARSAVMLTVSRGLQGVGAAVLCPAALAILMSSFPEGPQRAKAMSPWVAAGAGGGALGFVLGGVIVSALSWPWVFLVNVPIGVLLFAVAWRTVPESPTSEVPPALDIGGAVTAIGAMLCLVAALLNVQAHGWGGSQPLLLGAGALVLSVCFVTIERRHPAPLVRLQLFKVRSIAVANGITVLSDGGLVATYFILALYLQEVLGASPLQAGLAFLPTPVVLLTVSVGTQAIIRRLGVRRTAVLGYAITAIGIALAARIRADGSYASEVLPALLVTGAGMGVMFAPVILIATSNVAEGEAGMASGIYNMTQQLGASLGLALIVTIALNRTHSDLAHLGHAVTQHARLLAVVDGYRLGISLSAVAIALSGLLVLLLLRRHHVEGLEPQLAVEATG
jgi:EmrB/QacA subfamily drug resistance transporter